IACFRHRYRPRWIGDAVAPLSGILNANESHCRDKSPTRHSQQEWSRPQPGGPGRPSGPTRLERSQAEGGPEAVLDERAIARRQLARRLGGLDENPGKGQAGAGLHPMRKLLVAVERIDRECIGDAEASGDRDEIGAEARMAALHAGLAEMPIVEHDDREIARLLDGNGAE